MIDPGRASSFLAAGRIAVIGASDDQRNFGRTVVKSLADAGISVVAVHPEALAVAGTPCYPTIAAVPDEVQGAIIMVGRDESASAVQECIDRKIPRVWLFKGFGPGAVSEEAVQLCRDAGVEVIAGACPLMFLEPVTGMHKFHRSMRRLRGSLATSAA